MKRKRLEKLITSECTGGEGTLDVQVAKDPKVFIKQQDALILALTKSTPVSRLTVFLLHLVKTHILESP
jgi:hypothetical protein